MFSKKHAKQKNITLLSELGAWWPPKPPCKTGGLRHPDPLQNWTILMDHACTMIIVHAYFVADRSGGLGGEARQGSRGVWGAAGPPNDGVH